MEIHNIRRNLLRAYRIIIMGIVVLLLCMCFLFVYGQVILGRVERLEKANKELGARLDNVVVFPRAKMIYVGEE